MKRVIVVGLLVIILTVLTGCELSGRFDTDKYVVVEAPAVLSASDAFDNQNIVLTGRVEEVLERKDSICLQVDILHDVMLTGLYLYPDDIHVEYRYSDFEPHLLPGDVITLYGYMCGVTVYNDMDVRLMHADYIKSSRQFENTRGLVVKSYDTSNLSVSAVYSVTNNYNSVIELIFTLNYYDADGIKLFSETKSSSSIKRNDSTTFVFSLVDGLQYDHVDYEISVIARKYVDMSLDLLNCVLIYGDSAYNRVQVYNQGAKPFENIQVTVLYYDQDALLAVYVLDGVYETAICRLASGHMMELVVPAELSATSYELFVTANRVVDK